MDRITAGIDVSKDRLDVAVRPSGEALAVERTAAGLEELCRRLTALRPHVVVLEATGGLETVVVAALSAAGLPVVVVNPAQIRAFAKALGQRAKTDPSTPTSSPALPRRSTPRRGRCPMRRRACWPISSSAAGRSST